jgi:hypothetical protein
MKAALASVTLVLSTVGCAQRRGPDVSAPLDHPGNPSATVAEMPQPVTALGDASAAGQATTAPEPNGEPHEHRH